MTTKTIKKIALASVIFLVISNFFYIVDADDSYNTTSIENLSFKQEIEITIDTSLDAAKYQPIDINVEFSDLCWAKNETINSVRIGYDSGSEIIELESQIYDLKFCDDTHISSCNLVFLIPSEADGTKKYYVFYDSKETKPANYQDHIIVEDTNYFYEPISGQKIDFEYYKITEDNYVTYGIVQKGELLGNPIALSIAKFKPETKVVETYNIDQLTTFDMRYGINKQPSYYGSAWAETVSKSVLVDGNLMTRIRIEGYSPDKTIKSDNIYTYYYRPTDEKKIIVNCHHEVLEDIDIPDPELYDGTYAGIVSIKSRSATIEKMNVGEILPEINIYAEDGKIKKYDVPQNPESDEKEAVLSTEADIDLGEKAWVGLCDPSTKRAYCLIFDSIEGINPDEPGAQVKAWVKQNVKLPGIEADTGNLFLLRNAYEKNSGKTTKIPKDFTADFNIEFISVKENVIEKINSESTIFQTLIKSTPIKRGSGTDKQEEPEKYNLEIRVHLAPSFPLGSLLSAASGKNLSYIYAELYKDTNLKSSGAVSRISVASFELDLEGKKLFEKLKTIIGLFDWENASFFKKIIFPDVETGEHIVKIYRENPLFKDSHQFIGFGIADVNKDTKLDISCRPQATILFSIINQNNNAVQNAEIILENNGHTIEQKQTDENGKCQIYAPIYPLKPYNYKIFYNGFKISEKQVKLGLKNNFIDIKEECSIQTYDLILNVKDTWGFAPSVDLNPSLTSSEMANPVTISADETNKGEYIFRNLYPADYDLTLSYKSFVETKNIDINKNMYYDTVFPAEYKVEFFVKDFYGQNISKKEIKVIRNKKEIITNVDENGKAFVSVPPGEYEVFVKSNKDDIAKQKIVVHGEKNVDILTKEQSTLHRVIVILGVLLLAVSIFLMFCKKRRYAGFKILLIALLIISIFSSWWSLSGNNESVETSTNTMLIPQKIVSFVETSNVMGGEISQVPEEVTTVLNLLQILVIATILLLVFSIISREKLRKTTMVLSILSFITILLAIVIFYIAMNQITEIGVGSFIGNGNIDITIPGSTQVETVKCYWGPGIGFIFGIIAIIIQIGIFFIIRRKTDLLD